MPERPLLLDERVEIQSAISREEETVVIAARLCRHRSTIWAEIGRNGGRDGYRATVAQRRADACRRRPKTAKLAADRGLAAEVTQRLEAKDSPKRIAIELTAAGRPISHECIYRAIYTPNRGLKAGLGRCLHLHRTRRKPRRGYTTPGSHSLGEFTLIHQRPAIAAERVQVGHLEGDLIVGAYNRSALITVFDRASRHLWLAQPANKTADATGPALIELLERIPALLRRTLTWDQGAELAHHQMIAAHTGIDIYFADAKSPWQRPTNEAGNALVRRYVGKGTNLNNLTTSDLRHIEQRINTIPRRTLNWTTAHHTYTAAVAMTD